MVLDKYEANNRWRSDPFESGAAINLAADTAFSSISTQGAPATRGLWVGGAGNVKVDLMGGGTVTFTGVLAGTLLQIRASKIYSTTNGTTASNLVALW